MWRAFCLVSMGVDIPAATVTSLLQEQADWEKKRQKASSMESLRKRYVVIFRFDHNIDILLQEPAEKGEESTI